LPDPNLLLGFETNDDAAIYRIDDQTAAVLTLDFFTPVVDDPYEFGCIAAANALSDVFAMGARPVVALNILAAGCSLGPEVAGAILRGGADKVCEAGAIIVGGHTIDDDEPKYGLSVFGTVHPDHIVRNEGARAGDVLFYTKRLGTGIMTSALRAGLIDDEGMKPVSAAMMELNRAAAEAMVEARVHAATDVTGFGLAGHLHEMLEASGVAAVLDFDALPLHEGVYDYAQQMCRPDRSFALQDWAEPFVAAGDLDEETYDVRMGVVCDPQTSGGLLISLAPEDADTFVTGFEQRCGRIPACVGTVVDGEAGAIRFANASGI
jgi:selenide, water dikinase